MSTIFHPRKESVNSGGGVSHDVVTDVTKSSGAMKIATPAQAA